jgi:hypothetical protein
MFRTPGFRSSGTAVPPHKNIQSERDEAQRELRKLAAMLTGFSEERLFFRWPRVKIIKEVSSCLVGLSNSLESPHPDKILEHNESRVKKIRKMLYLRITDL